MTSMTPVVLLVSLALVAPQAAAQTRTVPQPRDTGRAGPADELTLVGRGWSHLAQGDLQRAAATAAEAVKAFPRGAAALSLALEVELARGKAHAGLDFYERWLGKRTLEEPAAVRRVAIALLREISRQPQSAAALNALRALAADGDLQARADLAARAASGGTSEARLLAAEGDESAVRQLIQESKAPGGRLSVADLQALGSSRSPAAHSVLVEKLQDPRPEIRGAAADALGRFGVEGAIAQLRPLLEDQSAHVRVQAAAALYRLNDTSGAGVFQQVLQDEKINAAGRLIVAEAMASRPDDSWRSLVRDLTAAEAPEIRLSAARLAASFDPALATTVFQALSADANPAIREAAARALASEAAGDLTTLRGNLRASDPLTQVAAAATILRLTR